MRKPATKPSTDLGPSSHQPLATSHHWPIEPIHGGLDALGDPHGDGLGGEDQGIVDDGSFGASEPAQDVVGGVDVVAVADPDAEAGELVGPEVAGNVAQAFLTAVGPSWP